MNDQPLSMTAKCLISSAVCFAAAYVHRLLEAVMLTYKWPEGAEFMHWGTAVFTIGFVGSMTAATFPWK